MRQVYTWGCGSHSRCESGLGWRASVAVLSSAAILCSASWSSGMYVSSETLADVSLPWGALRRYLLPRDSICQPSLVSGSSIILSGFPQRGRESRPTVGVSNLPPLPTWYTSWGMPMIPMYNTVRHSQKKHAPLVAENRRWNKQILNDIKLNSSKIKWRWKDILFDMIHGKKATLKCNYKTKLQLGLFSLKINK